MLRENWIELKSVQLLAMWSFGIDCRHRLRFEVLEFAHWGVLVPTILR